MEFDFERLYLLYPRKEGKVRGLNKAAKTITNIVDYRRFERAVNNYAKLCVAEAKPKKFILMWQTFVNGRWEDYVDAESISPQLSSNATLARRIISGDV